MKGLTGELTALIGVEDLRLALAQGFLQGFNTEVHLQGVGQPPGQHIPAVPVHDCHRLFLVQRRLARAAAFSVSGESLPELVGQAQVVDYQATGLVLEHPVHPGDGLHQPVAPHRLVHVHRVEAGRVKAGEPHIPHQHDL